MTTLESRVSAARLALALVAGLLAYPVWVALLPNGRDLVWSVPLLVLMPVLFGAGAGLVARGSARWRLLLGISILPYPFELVLMLTHWVPAIRMDVAQLLPLPLVVGIVAFLAGEASTRGQPTWSPIAIAGAASLATYPLIGGLGWAVVVPVTGSLPALLVLPLAVATVAIIGASALLTRRLAMIRLSWPVAIALIAAGGIAFVAWDLSLLASVGLEANAAVLPLLPLVGGLLVGGVVMTLKLGTPSWSSVAFSYASGLGVFYLGNQVPDASVQALATPLVAGIIAGALSTGAGGLIGLWAGILSYYLFVAPGGGLSALGGSTAVVELVLIVLASVGYGSGSFLRAVSARARKPRGEAGEAGMVRPDFESR
jgi:hypothetical protein